VPALSGAAGEEDARSDERANADADAPSPPRRLQQNEAFRKELGNPQFVDAVLYRQQFNHWRFNAPNRMADALRLFEQQAQAAKDAASAAGAEAAATAEIANNPNVEG